ncbi:MAG TPA: hypothetical protein VM680_14940 [Verrucomicrobiae bacterium]|nr:hypothetical protein [Verrucomicrobiae bacterium]
MTWVDMGAGNGRFVGIAGVYETIGYDVYVSSDGRAWKRAAIPNGLPLREIDFCGGTFFALGPLGQVLTSTDGEAWVSRPINGAMRAAAAGNGVTVLVGENATILFSTDLQSWRRAPDLGTGYHFVGVAFGNGRFIAIGEFGRIFTSTDGENWTPRTWPAEAETFNTMYDYTTPLVFSNGRFAMSARGIFTTLNGVEWEFANPTNSYRLAATGSGFIGVNGIGDASRVAQSADGRNWEIILEHPSGQGVFPLTTVAAENGAMVAGGIAGFLYYSPAGGPWQPVVGYPNFSRPHLAFGNGDFLRFGSAGGVEISKDGAVWELVPDAPPLASVAFGDNMWIGSKTNGVLTSSPDARVWRDIETTVCAGNLKYANGIFVGESSVVSATATNAAIASSGDGRNWKVFEFPESRFVKVIGYANNRWAGTLYWQVPVTSEDGETWRVHPSQPDIRGPYFAAGNGRFVGMGGGGMGPGVVSWSFDGIHWQSQRWLGGTTYMEQMLTYGGGLFIHTDNVGGVYVSGDGVNWSGERESRLAFSSAAYGNGRWLVAGGDSLLRSIGQMGGLIQLENLDAAGFSLRLFAPAGQNFEIQSAADPAGGWSILNTVQIPAAGDVSIPMSPPQTKVFYRAVAK